MFNSPNENNPIKISDHAERNKPIIPIIFGQILEPILLATSWRRIHGTHIIARRR